MLLQKRGRDNCAIYMLFVVSECKYDAVDIYVSH